MIKKNLKYDLSFLQFYAIFVLQFQKMDTAFFSTAYLPPIEYFSKISECNTAIIEQWENFGKRSYRNRCSILTANGVIDLSIPVNKANSKILSKDIRINYDTRWQKIHERGIISAYTNSPYFEYYIDDFLVFFQNKYIFLFDLNMEILQKCMEIIGINTKISLSDSYLNDVAPASDFRETIHPKIPCKTEIKPYRQTFSDRFDFIPNLSILDLIFCQGTEASMYL